MGIFRLLIVEDNDSELATCRDTISRYNHEKNREIELVECKSVKEALEKLDNTFDGAIIDLRLADQGDEGNQIINRIAELHFRIPVAILTGTPDAADLNFAYIGVFKKGDPGAGYADLLDRFWEIHNTGLTRIMGGRGIIEETLNTVFQKNLLPQSKVWVAYGEVNSLRTEKALLRHALNHLLQLLDDDDEQSYPEEMYLFPPLTNKICTGSIVKEKKSDQYFVVMNPACDLVVRENGTCKTDRVLVVEIDHQATLFPNHTHPLSKSQENELKNAFKNTKTAYYHWLPKTIFFEGGFLNFRKLSTLSNVEFKEQFVDIPIVQISSSFIKDIIARFSAYYARQGQPDIDYAKHITLIENIS